MAKSLSEMDNLVSFFEAFQSGDMSEAKKKLGELDLSSLTSGHPDYVKEIAGKLRASGLMNEMKKTDRKGDTALHLAVRAEHVDLVRILVKMDGSLCDCANREEQTPLKLAVSLGFEEGVKLLLTHTKNALHYIVELNQVELVIYLMKKEARPSKLMKEENVDLSKHINEPYREEGKHSGVDECLVREGDTPLHIAARNKYEDMVSLLLKIPEVNKLALNSEDKTPFDVAREVTEYHESLRTIRRLRGSPQGPKRFMYCGPHVSHKKYKNAIKMLKDSYEQRRNSELVVAALLAAMTCGALFTVPGGFKSEVTENGGNSGQQHRDQGTPLLISLFSFKLFIVFDCIAFFLSLFVCIMWEMSSELTTENEMMFMSLNSLLVCLSFGFSAFGFMCAVYTMMARKVKTFSWVVLGSLIFITLCGVLAFVYQFVHFAVKRARANHLCGISLCCDAIVKKLWCEAERFKLLDAWRLVDEASCDLITGLWKFKSDKRDKNSNSMNSSPSCCVNRV